MKKKTAAKKRGKYEPGDFNLKVKRSLAGLGLFALEDIPKGACIIDLLASGARLPATSTS